MIGRKGNAMINWKKVENYLQELEEVYSSIGMPGMFVLGMLVGYRERYDDGERTNKLYKDIMDIKL